MKEKMEEKEKVSLPKVLNRKAVMPPVCKRFTKEEVERIIDENYGILTLVCGILDCTPKQFYIAVDKWGLRDHLKEAKN